jgi:nitronate monooxygenase
MATVRSRVEAFCGSYGLRLPVVLAPMAGVSAPVLSGAVMAAGGMGACGALLMPPEEMLAWVRAVRALDGGPFLLNLWVPEPPPFRDLDQEARIRRFLADWGPPVPEEAGETALPDFEAQCEALLESGAPVASSVMGLFPPAYVARLKAGKRAWFANVSTLGEALAAEAAGADVIVAQGMEAGGHRGCFDATAAERGLVGLFALLPAIADAVRIPVVAAGVIADGRGLAAALALGASAVAVGTGFLRCPEAGLPRPWADGLAAAAPEGTVLTRAFSGRVGRSLATDYVRAAGAPGAPAPAPYPVQRGLTAGMRAAAVRAGDLQRMQAWAGQSARLASSEPAAELAPRWWAEAQALLA